MQALDLLGLEVRALLERARAAPPRGSRRPRSGRCRRSCAGRAAGDGAGGAGRSASANSSSGGAGQASGPSVATISSVGDVARPAAASPRRAAWSRTRAAAARGRRSSRISTREARSLQRGALVEELQAARRHQVDEQGELAVGDPARANSTTGIFPIRRTPVDLAALERRERRVEASSARPSRAPAPIRPRRRASAGASRRAAISTSGSSGIDLERRLYGTVIRPGSQDSAEGRQAGRQRT